MTVQISEGLYLSDKNARIFAMHMLADLQRYNDKVSRLYEQRRRCLVR